MSALCRSLLKSQDVSFGRGQSGRCVHMSSPSNVPSTWFPRAPPAPPMTQEQQALPGRGERATCLSQHLSCSCSVLSRNFALVVGGTGGSVVRADEGASQEPGARRAVDAASGTPAQTRTSSDRLCHAARPCGAGRPRGRATARGQPQRQAEARRRHGEGSRAGQSQEGGES